MTRPFCRALTLAMVATVALSTDSFAQRTAGVRPDLTSDEGGLWAMAEKAEQQARLSGELNSDPVLTRYVTGVACKVASDYCGDIRVYVMNRPFFNATMSPNGYTEVWSGVLLRASNEAELAEVLGHESTHFIQSHTVVRMRSDRTRQNVMLGVSVVIAVAGAAAAAGATTYDGARAVMDSTQNLVNVLYLGSLAAFFRFSRDQESEADLMGLKSTTAAGYDPRAAVTLWESQIEETKASDFERVRKRPTRTNIFDSHPIGEERIAVLRAALPAAPAGDLGQERYRAAIRPHLKAWLRDDLRRKDFGQTLHIIGHLSTDQADAGVLKFFEGECYRLRAKPGDLATAMSAYRAATGYPDAPVETWRELGETLVKQKDAAGARIALQTYLDKAPGADDAWLIKEELDTLKS